MKGLKNIWKFIRMQPNQLYIYIFMDEKYTSVFRQFDSSYP